MQSALPRRQYDLPFPTDPPPDSSLLADEQTIETMLSADYWRKMCPQLTVGGICATGTAQPPLPE
eukprot:SAG31_NODE_27122_length_431_cov_0.710843_1_plen_64_part_01